MTEFEGIGYEDDYYCLYAWPRTFPLSSNESNGSNGAFRKAQKCDLRPSPAATAPESSSAK
jgi:hypothetical protein